MTFLLITQDTRRFSILVLEAKATGLKVKGFFDGSTHYQRRFFHRGEPTYILSADSPHLQSLRN